MTWNVGSDSEGDSASQLQFPLGLNMGNLQVGFSHTVPVSWHTVPVVVTTHTQPEIHLQNPWYLSYLWYIDY